MFRKLSSGCRSEEALRKLVDEGAVVARHDKRFLQAPECLTNGIKER